MCCSLECVILYSRVPTSVIVPSIYSFHDFCHHVSFTDRYPHIEKDHLVKLLKQLILNPPFPPHMRVEGNTPNAADVPTLLGSGTFSLVDRT